jgi:hypothetical protein
LSDRKELKDIPIHYTKAIKGKKDRFAFVFSRRFSSMKTATYDLPNDGGEHIEITSFETRKATFCMSIFVSDENTQFLAPVNFAIAWTSLFGQFRLLLLGSFMPLPSDSSGNLNHSMTSDPDTAHDAETARILHGIMEGLDQNECIEFHRSILNHNLDEMISTLISIHGPAITPNLLTRVRSLGFSKEADFQQKD